MDKKIKTEVAIGIVLLVSILIGLWFYVEINKSNSDAGIVNIKPIDKKSTEPNNDEIMCTQEAMLCPDGSYVSRTGPKCEFASCPISGGVEDHNKE